MSEITIDPLKSTKKLIFEGNYSQADESIETLLPEIVYPTYSRFKFDLVPAFLDEDLRSMVAEITQSRIYTNWQKGDLVHLLALGSQFPEIQTESVVIGAYTLSLYDTVRFAWLDNACGRRIRVGYDNGKPCPSNWKFLMVRPM